MGFKLSLKNIAGAIAAPFTGGASLLATDVGQDLIKDITGQKAAEKANAANIEQQNYWNERNIEQQNYWNNKQIELANTAHQREVEDLKAAGLNPILSANGGAATPGLGAAQGTAATVQNTMPGGYMSQMLQGASLVNTLAQAKNLGVNSALQTAQTANTNAQTASTQLDTAIKKDMKPATIRQAYQNVENAVAQQKLIEAQTAQSGAQKANIEQQTKKAIGGKTAEYAGTGFLDLLAENYLSSSDKKK